MPHAITWLIPNRVIYFKVTGIVTSEELPLTDATVLKMIEQSDAPKVHILFDDTELDRMPGISEMLTLKYIRHERTGWIVTPQRNSFIRFVGSVVGQTAGLKFRFVDSLESGLQTLKKVDQSLPDVPELAKHMQAARERVSSAN
jgi:hypothetical protein